MRSSSIVGMPIHQNSPLTRNSGTASVAVPNPVSVSRADAVAARVEPRKVERRPGRRGPERARVLLHAHRPGYDPLNVPDTARQSVSAPIQSA